MSDRHFNDFRQSTARSIRFAAASSWWQLVPTWCYVSAAANFFFVALLLIVGMRSRDAIAPSVQLSGPAPQSGTILADAKDLAVSDVPSSDLGPRLQLTYQEWVDILAREAEAMAENPPPHLSILLGDSISLWFPYNLLPTYTTWLNQGISGEISEGLLKRLDLIEATNPDVMFVMIGINDLTRGINDTTILSHHRQIVRDLKAMHPDARIVVQSILPHAGDRVTWEGRDRLVSIPNERIRALNESLQAIAAEEGVEFLNLYPLFSDGQGALRVELTTDGLHLNNNGYLVWASALQMYQQLEEE